MIYKNFEEWADGQWLEDGEPRKQAYTRDELLLIEMGWNYGVDAARLAQPEPEPAKLLLIPALMEQAGWVRKREWQGLTDDEKEDVLKGSKNAYDAIERIEAKLREKNT